MKKGRGWVVRFGKEKRKRRREGIGKLPTLEERCDPVSKRAHRMKRGGDG